MDCIEDGLYRGNSPGTSGSCPGMEGNVGELGHGELPEKWGTAGELNRKIRISERYVGKKKSNDELTEASKMHLFEKTIYEPAMRKFEHALLDAISNQRLSSLDVYVNLGNDFNSFSVCSLRV